MSQRDCLTDRLADLLLRRVYVGAYPPGTRLPPERALAIEFGTDSTSSPRSSGTPTRRSRPPCSGR